MKWTTRAALAFSIALGLTGTEALAQNVGQGAIVVRNTDHDGMASIYAQSEGDEVEYQVAQNDFVAGYTSFGPLLHSYAFDTNKGRIHVVYFPNKNQKGTVRTAWMNPDDLSIFAYDCSCGASSMLSVLKAEACSPFAPSSLTKLKWNACFVQARDRRLADLQNDRSQQDRTTAIAANGDSSQGDRAGTTAEGDGSDKPLTSDYIAKLTGGPANSHADTPPEGDGSDRPLSSDDIARLTSGDTTDDHAGNTTGADSPKQSKGLTNREIVSLVKAGLGDEVVIDKIRTSAGDKLDTSTEALIRLKKAGVSGAIIDAVVKRAAGN